MSAWLCIPLNVNLTVSGKYSSDIQRSIDITVSKCTNKTNDTRPCASEEDIEAFLSANNQLFITPFFTNPLINPQNADYLSSYLEDKYYVMIGPNYGAEMYIYNADYLITTDESILPFTAQHVDAGPILSTVQSNVYLMGNTSEIYCFIYFYRSAESFVIDRSFQKIIDAFSYVGGLLGAVLIMLIFVNFYNEYSYEMMFAQGVYRAEEGSPTSFDKYNLLYYFLQTFYSALRTLRVRCGWCKKVEFFFEARRETLKQLDVKFLFKKVHFLETAVTLLFSKPQLSGLLLQHTMTLSEARRLRKMYGVKRDVARFLQAKAKPPNDGKEALEDNRNASMNISISNSVLEGEVPRLRDKSGTDKLIMEGKTVNDSSQGPLPQHF